MQLFPGFGGWSYKVKKRSYKVKKATLSCYPEKKTKLSKRDEELRLE